MIPEDNAEIMKIVGGMVAGFKRAKPDFTGPITPTESVSLMLNIIHTLKPEENGTFISQNRNTDWL